MEWPFSRARNYFQGPKFAGKSLKFRRKSDFHPKFQTPKFENSGPKFAGKSLKFRRKSDFHPKFQTPKFENLEPAKLQFHTSSHAIPPLDCLLRIDAKVSVSPEFKCKSLSFNGRHLIVDLQNIEVDAQLFVDRVEKAATGDGKVHGALKGTNLRWATNREQRQLFIVFR